MRTSDFSYKLPDHLIAQYPSKSRGDSRLLVVDRGSNKIHHSHMKLLPDWLDPATTVVLNDTKVRKARLHGRSETGATIEFLFVSQLSSRRWLTLASKAKRQLPGRTYSFEGGVSGAVVEIDPPYRILEFERPLGEDYLEQHGHVPLPPYIRRGDEPEDAIRYQTVFSSEVGSAAAPTAGLHLTEELLASLEERCSGVVRVTLHVGAGTFLPVRTEQVGAHSMHTECYNVSDATATAINLAMVKGERIVAVGTTSVRALESSFREGAVRGGGASTGLFIYPGYKFKVVDAVLTNFHASESTLLMLVSAFAGVEVIRKAYSEAIEKGYRFLSYGDAMLIL